MDFLNCNKPDVNFVIEKLKYFNGTTTVKGPCSIGIVIEQAFGRNPNNDPSSDTFTHEVKATQGKCDITLFSKRPERGDTYRIVEEYGYRNEKDKQSFMKDISHNSSKLICYADNIGVGIYDSETKEEICYWGYYYLKVGFDKINNVLKVLTKSKKLKNGEEEHSVKTIDTFDRFNSDKFIDFINNGAIVISPRRYFKSDIPNPRTGRYPSRDRGCAFRIDQKHFKEMYETQITH